MNNSSSKFLFSSVAAVCVLLTACRDESPGIHQSAPLPVARVTVTQVAREEVVEFASLPGTVVPSSEAVLESKITGRVVAVNAAAGQGVEAGQWLVQVDAPEITAQVAQTTAALTLARQSHQRIERLFEKQSATRAELDAAVSQLNQAEAALDAAESRLADARIVAPFTGVISSKQVDVGDLATPGRALLTVESNQGRRFEAGVPESLLPVIRLGGTNSIVLQNLEGPVSAVVGEIHPAGDPGSRSWTVKWNLPADVEVPSGGYGQVAIPSGRSKSIRIPVAALIFRGQLEQVYVMEQGHAVIRLVRTGDRVGDRISVLSGLTAGDQLIVAGLNELQNGQPVEEKAP